MYLRILILIIAFSSPALAQQDDSALIRKALDIVANQRNQALGDAAVWQAKAMLISEDLTKAQARIKELETKNEGPNDKK